MIFRRRKQQSDQQAATSGVAVAEPVDDGFEDTPGILAEIRTLSAANRNQSDTARERELLRLRHLAGARLIEEADPNPEFAVPDIDSLGSPGAGLFECTPDQLTPELLRAAILRDGCLLVRGALQKDVAEGLANGIDRAFADRDAHDAGRSVEDSLYEEFAPLPTFPHIGERPWIKDGGGVLAVDSPRLAEEMLEAFDRINLATMISSYLGEPALISAQKCTLRKADPSVPGAWHQDGAFLGDVRSMNVWMSLSHCGDTAPGLDIVPRRLDDLVEAGGEGTMLSIQVSQQTAERAADDKPILRPIFEPGDMLLFDDLFLHQTASDPEMPNPRYAIESWFFGASAFPEAYAPLAP